MSMPPKSNLFTLLVISHPSTIGEVIVQPEPKLVTKPVIFPDAYNGNGDYPQIATYVNFKLSNKTSYIF